MIRSGRWTAHGAAAVLAASLFACVGNPGYTKVTLGGGVTLLAPGSVSATRTPERMTFVSGDWQIDVVDRQLTMNGREYGTVRPGDQIRLTDDGDLYVNGEKREPKDP